MKAFPLVPVTVIGSYPQPDWLVNREVLTGLLRGLVEGTAIVCRELAGH